MNDWHLKLELFQGPLDALLSLIEQKKLEISRISLAQVTADFLDHLSAISKEVSEEQPHHTRQLAEFVLVASRLVLIKSKSLLPDMVLNPDEEAQIQDLENRLKYYQKIRPAMRLLQKEWQKGSRQYSRNSSLQITAILKLLALHDPSARRFYPGASLNAAALAQSMGRLSELLRKTVYEEVKVETDVMTLEEAMQSMVGRLGSLMQANFSAIANNTTRAELIVLFLALLHLARDQMVRIEQEGAFSDIIINRPAGNTGAVT
jgi:segregation and condensation protein A